jgi:hypothetical protein
MVSILLALLFSLFLPRQSEPFVRESCEEDTFARVTLKFFRHGHALHCLLPVPSQNLTHGKNRGGFHLMSGWNHQACSNG